MSAKNKAPLPKSELAGALTRAIRRAAYLGITRGADGSDEAEVSYLDSKGVLMDHYGEEWEIIVQPKRRTA